MNNNLQIFKNEEFGQVRSLTIDNVVYFVGKDVAEALGYVKPLNALSTHVDGDDSLKQGLIDNLGRKQETILINESGLYSLVLSSKLESAKKFKRWVTSEVLPALRKTGSYNMTETVHNPKIAEINAKVELLKQATEFLNASKGDINALKSILNDEPINTTCEEKARKKANTKKSRDSIDKYLDNYTPALGSLVPNEYVKYEEYCRANHLKIETRQKFVIRVKNVKRISTFNALLNGQYIRVFDKF